MDEIKDCISEIARCCKSEDWILGKRPLFCITELTRLVLIELSTNPENLDLREELTRAQWFISGTSPVEIALRDSLASIAQLAGSVNKIAIAQLNLPPPVRTP